MSLEKKGKKQTKKKHSSLLAVACLHRRSRLHMDSMSSHLETIQEQQKKKEKKKMNNHKARTSKMSKPPPAFQKPPVSQVSFWLPFMAVEHRINSSKLTEENIQARRRHHDVAGRNQKVTFHNKRKQNWNKNQNVKEQSEILGILFQVRWPILGRVNPPLVIRKATKYNRSRW